MKPAFSNSTKFNRAVSHCCWNSIDFIYCESWNCPR